VSRFCIEKCACGSVCVMGCVRICGRVCGESVCGRILTRHTHHLFSPGVSVGRATVLQAVGPGFIFLSA